ncbi:arsenate reductase ArsC [Paludibaculum fermentans]|uniref:arsenate reductase ArsC n=1 Tax=Paludibaculum fermentans TaxID=1473598 RepID=UPI003EBEA5AA
MRMNLPQLAAPLVTALALLLTAPLRAEDTKPAKTRVLVLCTGNSARSQMAAGFLKSWDARLDVYSAGTNPAPRINPLAVAAMKEANIDISSGYPKAVAQYVPQSFDYVITVCDDADKNCPNFQGKVGKRVHIGFPDPAKATGTDEQKMAVFRKVRDDIQTRLRTFYQQEIRKKL